MEWFNSLEPGLRFYDTVEKEEFTVIEKSRSSWHIKRPHLKMHTRIYLIGDVLYIQWTQVGASHRPLHIENLVRIG
jgi:hypothetical protein